MNAYARAAMGKDKIDKQNLPKVMQVKKFGFVRQNTKYKGCAKEDTTDKEMECCRLSRSKRKEVKKMVINDKNVCLIAMPSRVSNAV
jgi:hypothetical protein